jgi:hypothetical protein
MVYERMATSDSGGLDLQRRLGNFPIAAQTLRNLYVIVLSGLVLRVRAIAILLTVNHVGHLIR